MYYLPMETWAPTGHEGYEVSDDGRVRSWWGYGAKSPAGPPRIMSPGLVRGYHQVTLCDRLPRRHPYVHQLVLEAFVGPAPAGMQVAHINGNPLDNRLSNLRYETPAENQADRIRHGTDLAGSRHPQARLSEADVRAIRQLYAAGGVSYAGLGVRFGISKTQVGQIVRGERRARTILTHSLP